MRPSEVHDSVPNSHVHLPGYPIASPTSTLPRPASRGPEIARPEKGPPDLFSPRPLRHTDYISLLLIFMGLVAVAHIVTPEPSQASADAVAIANPPPLPRPLGGMPGLADPALNTLVPITPAGLSATGLSTSNPGAALLGTPTLDTAGTLGTLLGAQQRVHILSTPDGPRYTITDTDGRILAEQLTDSELRTRFPDLADQHAGSLMMVTEP